MTLVTTPDAVPEQVTHCAPRRVDGGFVLAHRVEPGAMRAGDSTGGVGDRGDQRRPDLGRRVGIGPVIAAGMKAQRCGPVQLQPPVQGDEVEEIAMLAGGGVSPFAGGALSAVRSCEANEQAAAWRVGNVADDPVATPAAAVGEVAAAHRLGITRETARQVGSLRRHVAHPAVL
jgi:hypothetical protein